MPKKQPKNAFFYFMLDFKQKQEKQGIKFRGMPDVADKAGLIWKDMKPNERAPYDAQAKDEKMKLRKNNEKLTSQGIPLSYIENEAKQKDLTERLMKKEIEDTVKQAYSNDTLAEQTYYFIMANYFAKTLKGAYIPAEIALSKYSLKDGIINKFHSYINPGNLPIGMGYQAKSHSENTHQLPIPPQAMGESNYGLLMREIYRFVGSDENGKVPPLYTHKDHIPMVESVIETLQSEHFTDEKIQFRIYPLQYLFYTLKTATAEKGDAKKPESIFVSEAIFERDTYEYQHGIACDYHDKLDVSKYCALSYTVRWGYMFSDYMCYDLALDMVAGVHVPLDADLKVAKMSSTRDISSYSDDNKSIVSTSARSYASTSANTHITQPKIERNYYDKNRDNYSKSGASAASKHKLTSPSSYGDSSDEGFDKEDNPWAVRNKNKPRVPSESSFSFSSNVGGRGQATLIKTEPNPYNIPNMGYGRGNLFRK